jgi:uncharacterized membrane-anchored protein
MKRPRSLPSRAFWITLLIPMIILLAMPIKPLLTLTMGKQITLLTDPLDPRDPFFGDYVQLRLAIEQVEEKRLAPEVLTAIKDPNRSEGIPVHVILEPQGSAYGVKQVTMEKPTTDLYLNGIIDPYVYHQADPSKPTYWIDYQLDRYYVEEKTGVQLEEWARQGQLTAYLKVKDGYGILIDLKKSS